MSGTAARANGRTRMSRRMLDASRGESVAAADAGGVERGSSGGGGGAAATEQSWLQYFLGDDTGPPAEACSAGVDAPDLGALKLDDVALDKALADLGIGVDAAPPPPAPRAKREGARREWQRGVAPTGCGPSHPMSTVLAVDGGWGDGERLKVAVSKARPLVEEARHNSNATTLAVMGNVAGGGDAAKVATSPELRAEFDGRLVLLASSFDLACLRLRDRGDRGELVMPPGAADEEGLGVALQVLQAPAPLKETPGAAPLPPEWTLHNTECAVCFSLLSRRKGLFQSRADLAGAVAIALLFKMASMMDRMLHAGGDDGMLAKTIDRLEATTLSRLKTQLGSMVNMAVLYEQYVALGDGAARITTAGRLICDAARRVVEAVVDWATNGAFDEYVESAKLVAFVPCHADEDPESLDGTWLASAGMGVRDGDGTIVGKELVRGVVFAGGFRVEWTQPSPSPRAWERALDEQFKRFYRAFRDKEEDEGIWTAIVALGCTKSDSGPTDCPSATPMPPSAFGEKPVGIFGASRAGAAAAAPVALTERSILWTEEDVPACMARWVRLARGQVSWGLVTHCRSTARAVSPHPNPIDRSAHPGSLQFDVSVALASLKDFIDPKPPDPKHPKPFEKAVGDLKGALGPCVSAGVGGQPHRVVWLTAPGVRGGVVMLLPEAYLQRAFPEYLAGSGQHDDGPCAVACGFLALSAAEAIPLKVHGLQVDEVESRVFWMRDSRHWSDATTGEALDAMRSARAARDHPVRLVAPGQDVGDSKLYYYSASSNDGLAGIRVRVANGNTAMPMLDADTSRGTGLQLQFESFYEGVRS